MSAVPTTTPDTGLSRRGAWAWVLGAHGVVGLVGALLLLNARGAWQDSCANSCEGFRPGPGAAVAVLVQLVAVAVPVALGIWLLVCAGRGARANEQACRRLITVAGTAAFALAALLAAVYVAALFQETPAAPGPWRAAGAVLIPAAALLPLAARARPAARLYLCTAVAVGALLLAAYLVVPAPLLILFAGLQLMAVTAGAFARAPS